MTHFLVYKCSEMLSINIYVTFLKGNTKHEAFTLTKIQFSIFFKAVLLLRRSIVVLHSPAVSSSKRSLRTLIYSTALPFAPVIKFLIIGITNLPPFHTNTHSFIRFTVSVASTWQVLWGHEATVSLACVFECFSDGWGLYTYYHWVSLFFRISLEGCNALLICLANTFPPSCHYSYLKTMRSPRTARCEASPGNKKINKNCKGKSENWMFI